MNALVSIFCRTWIHQGAIKILNNEEQQISAVYREKVKGGVSTGLPLQSMEENTEF